MTFLEGMDLTTAEFLSPCLDRQTEPYGSRATVLALATSFSEMDAKESHDSLDETWSDAVPTALCCPGCGTVETVYEAGLPTKVGRWETACSNCDVDLRRWWTIAVDAAYTDVLTPDGLTTMVQAAWNERLWAGVTNARDQVRQQEFKDRVTSAASAFNWDWELTCPLCRRPISETQNGGLDYHHWAEQPDIGVSLCRTCHKVISWDKFDEELDAAAHGWGLRCRNDAQVLRLAIREALATDGVLAPALAHRLVSRYNLVQSEAAIRTLIEELLKDQQLREQILDVTIAEGLAVADPVSPV